MKPPSQRRIRQEQDTHEESPKFECPRRELSQYHHIEQAADVFKEERPVRPVERKRLRVAADIEAERRGEEEEGEDEGCKHHGCPHAIALPVRETLQSEAGQTNDGSHDHHGVQADEAAADEAPHSQPAVGQTGIVGIAHDEAGEDEEEIHGQEAVVEMLFGSTLREGDGFKEMIDQYPDGGYSAQAIENDVALVHEGECL